MKNLFLLFTCCMLLASESIYADWKSKREQFLKDKQKQSASTKVDSVRSKSGQSKRCDSSLDDTISLYDLNNLLGSKKDKSLKIRIESTLDSLSIKSNGPILLPEVCRKNLVFKSLSNNLFYNQNKNKTVGITLSYPGGLKSLNSCIEDYFKTNNSDQDFEESFTTLNEQLDSNLDGEVRWVTPIRGKRLYSHSPDDTNCFALEKIGESSLYKQNLISIKVDTLDKLKQCKTYDELKKGLQKYNELPSGQDPDKKISGLFTEIKDIEQKLLFESLEEVTDSIFSAKSADDIEYNLDVLDDAHEYFEKKSKEVASLYNEISKIDDRVKEVELRKKLDKLNTELQKIKTKYFIRNNKSLHDKLAELHLYDDSKKAFEVSNLLSVYSKTRPKSLRKKPAYSLSKAEKILKKNNKSYRKKIKGLKRDYSIASGELTGESKKSFKKYKELQKQLQDVHKKYAKEKQKAQEIYNEECKWYFCPPTRQAQATRDLQMRLYKIGMKEQKEKARITKLAQSALRKGKRDQALEQTARKNNLSEEEEELGIEEASSYTPSWENKNNFSISDNFSLQNPQASREHISLMNMYNQNMQMNPSFQSIPPSMFSTQMNPYGFAPQMNNGNGFYGGSFQFGGGMGYGRSPAFMGNSGFNYGLGVGQQGMGVMGPHPNSGYMYNPGFAPSMF